jgi:hypothetical protein
MKLLFDLIPWPFRWAIGLMMTLVTIWGIIESRFDEKVHASEVRIMSKVDSYRREDMAVIKSIKEDTHIIKQTLIMGRK